MSDIELDFIACCPVGGCINNRPDVSFKWTHSNCGGYEKINGLGNLRCIKCNESGPAIDWKFQCENHEYKKTSKYGLANMLAILAQIESKNRGNIRFINSIAKSFYKMMSETDDDDFC